jgi:hypothetical protein
MENTEIRINDPSAVKAEVVAYIGNVIEEASRIAAMITDDATCDQAVTLGSMVKECTMWLQTKRREVYEPLYKATERVRAEYDDPLKLGKQIEKTLSAAVIDYRLKKKREEDRLRLAAEAEAKRVREEAERKEREAQAERERIIRERAAEEQRRRLVAEAEAKRQKEAKEAAEREAAAKSQLEADERARQMREEEEARLRNAQEAHDVGLTERSEVILDRQTPIAPIPAPLPTAAELAAKADKEREEAAALERARLQKEEERRAEDAKREADAARLRQMDEEAAQAKAKAAEAESLANASMTVSRPDDRLSTSVRHKWDIPDEAAFRKLVKAVAEGRAPVEYLDFDPQHPEKFRAAAVTKDLTRLKAEFNGEAIGIRVWVEEVGGFKAAKGDA